LPAIEALHEGGFLLLGKSGDHSGLGDNNFTATDAARNQVSYALIITGVT
jgi:hypothetical protein